MPLFFCLKLQQARPIPRRTTQALFTSPRALKRLPLQRFSGCTRRDILALYDLASRSHFCRPQPSPRAFISASPVSKQHDEGCGKPIPAIQGRRDICHAPDGVWKLSMMRSDCVFRGTQHGHLKVTKMKRRPKHPTPRSPPSAPADGRCVSSTPWLRRAAGRRARKDAWGFRCNAF